MSTRRSPTHGLAALLIAVVAGCSSAQTTPIPTVPVFASSPSPSPLRDLPGDGPPPTASAAPVASPTASGSTGGPAGDPWTGPAAPWPGERLATFPKNEISAVIGVAADGTILTHGSVSSADPYEVVRAFQPDGTPVSSWPADGVPVKGFFQDAVLADDGGVLIAMRAVGVPDAPPTELRASTIASIDAAGQVRSGWPVTRAAKIVDPGYAYGHSLLLRPDGGTCFVESAGMTAKPSGSSDLACLDADGKVAAGWPVLEGRYAGPAAIGADGTVFVVEYVATGAATAEGHVLAFGRDGRPVPGWTPPTIPAILDGQLVARGDGSLAALFKPYEAPPLLLAFGPDGSPDDAFATNAASILKPLGADAYPGGLQVHPDGTLLLSIDFVVTTGPSVPARILAFGADGAMRPVWPFIPGSPFLWAQPGPDGAIWVWMSTAGALTPRLAVLDTDGTIRHGWPALGPPTLHDLGFDSGGDAFYVSRPYGLDYLETIDEH